MRGVNNSKTYFVDVFEPWLRAYLQKYKGQSITTDEWKDFLYSFFSGQVRDTSAAARRV